MKNSIVKTCAAALVVGFVAVGCSKAKEENATAAQPTHSAPGGAPTTTPMTPDKKMDQAMQNMGANGAATTQKAHDMMGNMGSAIGGAAQGMSQRAHATTMP